MVDTPSVSVSLDDVRTAKERLGQCPYVLRTPLVRLRGLSEVSTDSDGLEIYLKLESLQATSSFKVRGASNAILCLDPGDLREGVCTASAGNFAQGLAWTAKEMGIPCNILIPDHTPQNKRSAMERHNGVLHSVPFDSWWKAIMEHRHATLKGHFIHPCSNSQVIAGNGTIGLEILEDLPDVDAVITPYGGGGLTCGVATVMRSLKPSVRCYAVEVETACPMNVSLAAGRASSCDYTSSFVDGIGGKGVLPEIFKLAQDLVNGSIVVSLRETANAVKLLLEKARIVAEGAGATPVAAALSGKAGGGKIVCVVSGGNIDSHKLIKILEGHVP